MDVLRWHVETQLITPEQKASELVSPAEDGGFRSESFLKKAFVTVAHLIGLEKKFTPRGMRRTFNDLARVANIITDRPRSSVSRHSATMRRTLSLSPRRSGMSPKRRSNEPMTGIRKSSCLAIHRMSHGRCDRRKGSRFDWWLATTTYARCEMSSGTCPSIEIRHSGESRVVVRPNRRNHLPVTRLPGLVHDAVGRRPATGPRSPCTLPARATCTR